ncbi:hypothetical protein TTHERM_01217220 (macronuclear) [Tetrahymena thermophila SB210]|uniref:Zinc finger lsd1 subclass family protein n=1 Tax=Tetrahymena thermophila (strain SB210) TaxID=312017 RepID=Q22WM4_TETTS|nr:hypothetical protein TTHERM_01217220 [Tetrahymena thermophila SB210]EAR89678.2 hypothetical protein TTHERM_01217220 [Tetrahymena thermophila SB210]|eukprot:XP_001009923.2 hypothetical protein TTHERM_01217220 [Tetrahymena thermophila SB210]
MTLFNLSRERIERNILNISLIILLICQESRAETLNDAIQDNCSLNYGDNLLQQIKTFASQTYTCYYYHEAVEDYIKNFNKIGEEKQNVYMIYSYFETNHEAQPKLEYARVSLTQYILYKKLSEQTSNCGDKNIAARLGTYDNCLFCMGRTVCDERKKEINSQLQERFTLINRNNTDPDFWTGTKVYVELFQILWNCNNPNDQLQITGIYDELTESKLLQTDVNGFENVCWNCNVQNCVVCSNDYEQCVSCKEGYFLKNNVCTQCSMSNCSNCDYDSNKDLVFCNQCHQDFYLLQGMCVEQCPEGYHVVDNECLKCQPGTFYSNKECLDCSKFCQQCTGPHPSQCEECSDGFILEEGKGCSLNDFDLTPTFKAKTFIDPRTNTLKECNFSCDECIDSSDLCIKCNPDLKYFVKEGERQRCYNRCPLYYQPKLTGNDFIECEISQSYTSDLIAADQIKKEASSRCPKQQYWNISTKQCNKCTNNCINCYDDSSCIECEPTYYWNDNRKTCSPCHPSCQKCSGPLQNNCLTCATGNKIFPDNNGKCGDFVSNPLPQSNILSQNEIYGNLQNCKQFLPPTSQQNYAVEFSQIYQSNDPKWKDVKMMSNLKPCTFQEFKNRYKYLKNSDQTCNDNEISQSTIGKNGDLLTIYSILLSQSGAQISNTGTDVNPQTLAEYAINNNLFSSSYIFRPTPNFSCNQLYCLSQLDSLVDGFTSTDSSKGITVQTLKEIVLTSTKQTPLSCFQQSQNVNQNTIYEIEQLVNNSKYTLNTTTKQYFILYLCGKDLDGNAVQRAMLVQKYLGNAFFEVLNVNNSQITQAEKISLYGASTEQNAYLKRCDSQLTNSLSSYVVQKIRVIQVVEQDTSIDKTDSMFQEYNEKVGPVQNSAKCTCVETKDYILANENQGNQFIRVITPQNKILTQSIDAFEINNILKKYNKDANVMKANGLSITKIEAEQIFKEYIEQTKQNTQKCFGLTNSAPLCIVNVLADMIFSNQQKCNSNSEIINLLKKSDFNALKDFIKKQNWCNLNSERCLKAQQTIKSCL